MFLSPNTVKSHARSIYEKLGVSSRAEAVECARKAGLLDADESVPTPPSD
ncbi:MAG TPA: LuxR C-terminal-related transcriptional regulator [Xanthobacteraceae bacterium]